MEIGMMWYCEDEKKSLVRHLIEAMEYYQDKYGKTPNIVFLHPSMVQDYEISEEHIEVETFENMQAGFLWLGVKSEEVEQI